MAKPGQTTGSTFIFSALFAVSALISGWIYGAALGARQPVSEVKSDFWGNWSFFGGIERFFNTTFAALMFSCFGVILGAVIGGVIGSFAPRMRYGVWISLALALAIPVTTRLSINSNEQGHLAGEDVAQAQQSHREQIAQQEHASANYQEQLDKMKADLQQFQNKLGDLNYAGSEYLGSPDPESLKYRSHDDAQTVENYYASILGTPFKHSAEGDPHPLSSIEFRHNGLHGELILEHTSDGTNDTFISLTALDF